MIVSSSCRVFSKWDSESYEKLVWLSTYYVQRALTAYDTTYSVWLDNRRCQASSQMYNSWCSSDHSQVITSAKSQIHACADILYYICALNDYSEII